MVGTRIFLQIDSIMQEGPQDPVRQSIVIFVKIALRQIDDGVRDAVALNDARFRDIHLVDFAAPAKPHTRTVSQRRLHRDYEPPCHLLVSRLGHSNSVRHYD